MKVLILGGGMSGLMAAKLIAEKGHKVIIIERDDVLGGLAGSFNVDGLWIPRTYHHFLPDETLMFKLLDEFNMKTVWNKSELGLWYDFKKYHLSQPTDILTFKPLSLSAKLGLVKLGIATLFPQKSDMDAETWIKGLAGEEVTEKIFQPLARIKFGELSTVSAEWLGSRLKESRSSKEKYAYLPDTLHMFFENFRKHLENMGVEFYLNCTVVKIDKERVSAKIGEQTKFFKFDKIISSIPPPVMHRICDIENKDVFDIEYKPMICCVASSKSKLTDVYWNIIMKPALSFGGIFNSTAINPVATKKGEHLYYFFRYCEQKDKIYKMPTEQIQETFIEDIKKFNPEFTFEWFKVFKIPLSSPFYKKGYKNLPVKINDWLYLTGVHMTYPSTRTLNSAAVSGIRSAKELLGE